MSAARKFYSSGLRFECTGCGECCKARHGYAYTYVTLEERRRLARYLGLETRAFTRKHCQKTNGHFHLKEPAKDCHFLDGSRCTVYHARPQQCRSWPFWPENMSPRVWENEVKRDCPGIGIGRLYKPQEIEVMLADEWARENKS